METKINSSTGFLLGGGLCLRGTQMDKKIYFPGKLGRKEEATKVRRFKMSKSEVVDVC